MIASHPCLADDSGAIIQYNQTFLKTLIKCKDYYLFPLLSICNFWIVYSKFFHGVFMLSQTTKNTLTLLIGLILIISSVITGIVYSGIYMFESLEQPSLFKYFNSFLNNIEQL